MFKRTSDMTKCERALAVLVLSKDLRAMIREKDPKAYEQALQALQTEVNEDIRNTIDTLDRTDGKVIRRCDPFCTHNH